MKAHAIIGANWGDEGKGVMTDYVCAKHRADVVVRFCGGAQAGHTVVTPEGDRHVFHHIGSGSYLGVPTFLSKFFVVNPLQFRKEKDATRFTNKIYVDPQAIVTIPADMLINQAYERAQGRYASCGIGINEAMQRSLSPEYRITVDNMHDRAFYNKIMNEYMPLRLEKLGLDPNVIDWSSWRDIHFDHVKYFLDSVWITDRAVGDYIVFEGAQGLMLDQHSPDFPYVTHANTGIKNVLRLCRDWDIDLKNLHATYVTRSYFTRHGAGPLPNEMPAPDWLRDDTNVMHDFQGPLRYAPLNVLALERRIMKDAQGVPFDVAVTHLDQCDDNIEGRILIRLGYTSHGPTRDHVQAVAPLRKEKV